VIEKLSYYFEHGVDANLYSILLAVIVMAIMIAWPKIPGKFYKQVPGSLVGIILVTLISGLAGWQVPQIGSIPRSIFLDERLRFDQIPWNELGNLVVPAMSIAALGTIESLLCGAVAGNMTGKRMRNSVELVGQGIGNIIIPFFGGVPATAAIARTSVGIKSGSVTRMTTILHGLVLLLAALLLAPVISQIPLAALAGVLFFTAAEYVNYTYLQWFEYTGGPLGRPGALVLILLLYLILCTCTIYILRKYLSVTTN